MSDWIISIVTQFGYFGIFLMMVLENIFPPIPSELIMPFAGFAAANGDLHIAGVMLAGTAGSIIGTLAWYYAARLLGLHRFRALCNRFGRFATIAEDDVDQAVHWFARYGQWAVLFGRLVPAVRTLISVPAGLAAMPLPLFLLVSTIGSGIWTAILTGAGFVLHEHYHVVEAWIDPISTGVVVLALALYVWRFITWKPIKTIG